MARGNDAPCDRGGACLTRAKTFFFRKKIIFFAPMASDGWVQKKRARDPEAAEKAWQDWQYGGRTNAGKSRGMSKKTAEAHLFCERMKTICGNLEKNARALSDAANLQHTVDEMRNLFVHNEDFLLKTDYANGEERSNRLRCHGALVQVVLQRYDEFEQGFGRVYGRGNVTSAQMNLLQIQMGCLRDALPPQNFSRSNARPQLNERGALEQLAKFDLLERVLV